MKKGLVWLLAAVLIVVLECAPLPQTDAAELSPVTLLTVSKTADIVCVRTDTGDEGCGRTLAQALDDLQQTSAKTLFFQTAQSIVFEEAALDLAKEAANLEDLRPATKVYLAKGELPPPEQAAEYLKLHAADATLGKLRAALFKRQTVRLPTVVYHNGRMRLV